MRKTFWQLSRLWETGNIGYLRPRLKTKKKITHHYMQSNTKNINKTWDLLQTTRGKDEPNIVFMQTSQYETKNIKTHTMTKHTIHTIYYNASYQKCCVSSSCVNSWDLSRKITVQDTTSRITCDTPYADDVVILLLMKGKLTIGKVSLRLS